MIDATEQRDDAELVAAVLAGDREAFGPAVGVLAAERAAAVPGERSAQAHRLRTSPTRGGVLAVHAADAGLVDRYAAAKAMEDTELTELYLTDLVPEEEVDGVLFAALDQPGVRLEVALPFGFDKDPKATSEHGGDNRREPATTGRRLRRERRIDRSVVSSARQARHHAP